MRKQARCPQERVKQATSIPQGKGKVHAETYKKLQKVGPNKASSVIFFKVRLNVWTQGASASSAAECLLPLALTCHLTAHLPRPATRAVGSLSPHFIEEKLRPSQGRQWERATACGNLPLGSTPSRFISAAMIKHSDGKQHGGGKALSDFYFQMADHH